MTAPNINDALAHLDDALDALTLEHYTAADAEAFHAGDWQRSPAVASSIAIELERIDHALGPAGKSMFAPLAEEIKRAVIGIVAAQATLRGERAKVDRQ